MEPADRFGAIDSIVAAVYSQFREMVQKFRHPNLFYFSTHFVILNFLCLALTLVNVRNNVNKTCQDVSAKQLRPSSVC